LTRLLRRTGAHFAGKELSCAQRLTVLSPARFAAGDGHDRLPDAFLARRFLARAFARAADRFARHFSHLQPRGVMTLRK
jgi:hypothetical protein